MILARVLVSLLSLGTLVSSLEINDNVVTIYNASDLIEFSNDVNSGTSYGGSTVLLADDIDFSGLSDKFSPIGNSEFILFRGMFDGQGHTVSNLAVNSSFQFVGLFGCTNGTSFKNVVVDSSCSIMSTYNFTATFGSVGGIIGSVRTKEKDPNAIVENCVNMARVTFAGGYTQKKEKRDITLSIAGVVGYFTQNNTDIYMRNCVNYGEVNQAGLCGYASMGGVLGAYFETNYFKNTEKCYVENCVNYGNLMHTGNSTNMIAMGIVGMSVAGRIENCVNFAIFISNLDTTALGKVLGGGNSNSNISNCFWTSEADNITKSWGDKLMTDPIVTNSHLAEPNVITLNKLNGWVESKGEENVYHRWVMLHLNGGHMGNVKGSALLGLEGLPFMEPTKEGCSFVCWSNSTDVGSKCVQSEELFVTEHGVTDIYALWNPNNYTVTFDFGNGTLINASFPFNSTIVYPNMSGVTGFYGWNSSLEMMPARNIVIGPAPPPEKSYAGAIAGGVIGGVALIAVVIAAVILLLTLRKYKARKSKWEMLNRLMGDAEMSGAYSRVAERISSNDINSTSSSYVVDSPAKYDGLYPENYKEQTIEKVLVQMGMDKDDAKVFALECKAAGKRAEMEGKTTDRFTKDNAAAIALYTSCSEVSNFEYSPYRIINKAIAGNDIEDLQNAKDLLFIVMTALRRLPRCEGKMLYRGTKSDIDKESYKPGSVVMWHGLFSVSTNMGAVKEFLTPSEEFDVSYGTLFVIEGGWGYDVQQYSLYPEEEEEILLEPERQFKVKSVIRSKMTVVSLQMLDTPLVLPRVFSGDI